MIHRHESVFTLWQGIPPLAEDGDSTRMEHFDESEQDGIDRLTDVSDPDVTFFPASGKGPHPAVLVCPGGGYSILAWNHEGHDICSLLNINGFSCFLLKYRCPDRRAAAFADAARAVRFIRANAAQFDIRPDKVGAIGFSAGGHLAAMISASAEGVPYPPADETDEYSFRPDFTALIYPAYLTEKDSLTLAPEFAVTPDVPPAFLLQAEDDVIRAENAVAWFLALKNAGVKAELHIYPEGGHGYGLLRTGDPVSGWGCLAAAWFRRQAGLK